MKFSQSVWVFSIYVHAKFLPQYILFMKYHTDLLNIKIVYQGSSTSWVFEIV